MIENNTDNKLDVAILPRPRLLRQIQRAQRAGPVYIIAPPGYGKSVLLREYVANEPGAMLINLRAGHVELAPLQHAIDNAPPQTPIVIDDAQHMQDAHDALQWILQAIRSHDRAWLIAGRSVPDELQAEIQGYTVLTTGDMTMTEAETDYLLQSGAQPIAFDTRRRWYTQTHGWPLAVSLAQRQSVPPHAGLAGDASHVQPLTAITRLAQSLLAGLSPDIQDFLLVTALPDRFSHQIGSHLLQRTRAATVALQAEVIRRNLFVSAADEPGWYRYHDLIREFLNNEARRRYGDAAVVGLLRQAAEWFYHQGDLHAAIDHALLAHDFPLAAAYLGEVAPTSIWDSGIFRTYQRWIATLDEETQAKNIGLLISLGRTRLDIGDRPGARTWLERAIAFARNTGQEEQLWEAQAARAKLHNMEGELSTTLAVCQDILDQASPHHLAYVQALNAAGIALTQLNRFQAARHYFEDALPLTIAARQAEDSPIEQDKLDRQIANLHHNLAMGVYIPLGQFETAQEHLHINDEYYARRPVARSLHLLTWCSLHEGIGDWKALAHDLAHIEKAEALSEHPDEENIWYFWFKALYHTSRGQYGEAHAILEELRPMMITEEDLLCFAYAETWLLRRQAKYDAAQQVAQAALATAYVGPLYRGMLGLELMLIHAETRAVMQAETRAEAQDEVQDTIQGSMQGVSKPVADPVPEDIHGLFQVRSLPWLVRLRAHLACLCYAQATPGGQRRARRHINRALHVSEQKFYDRLLIARDPNLGLRFWTLCLETGQAVTRAQIALAAIAADDNGISREEVAGNVQPLLDHSFRDARMHAAQCLARLGYEPAIPALAIQLDRESDSAVCKALEDALSTLEGSPPVPLQITLLGEFKVVRGNHTLTAAEWQRPAVRRLFQYFALHTGQMLSRDRILDDLWPESDPQAARNTLRTLFSWLRRALDPYLRPKTPARYFLLDGDIFSFGPDAVRPLIRSDMETFERTIQDALARAETDDLRLLPDDFLRVLENWAPLLPDLPYEPWAVTARERVSGLYVEGCLFAAQTLLNLRREPEAAQWARNAIQTAPWLEEAYQALMRAYARQGQRSLALRAYTDAVDALQGELDVAPSALTEWLAQRLRQGEHI